MPFRMPFASERLFEFVLWTIGLTCLLAFGANKVQSAWAQSQAIETLQSQWRDQVTEIPDQSLWSTRRVKEFAATSIGADRPVPLGLLSIPNVNIRVVVFDGTSDRVLNLGAGRIRGTAPIDGAGNLAIAAHRDGFFRGLKDIVVGDTIRLQHTGGSADYQVSDLSIVEPDDVSVLAPTDTPTITLITCYPFYFVGSEPQRFIVRAALQTGKTDD